jgi:hypothetical protein
MPQPISFDEIATSQKPAGSQITFDEVYSQRMEQARPGAGDFPKRGEVRVPGQGLPGAPNYQPALIAPRIEPATNANFGAAIKSELVEDQDTRIRLVSESLGVDPKRVGIVDDKPVFVNDQGQLQYVSGFGSRTGAAVVGNAPEIAGGIVGSFAASPIAGSTLGASGARGIKRAAAGLLFDEPQTIGGNLRDVATEGAVNLASAGAGKLITKAADRGKVVDFSPSNRTAAEAVVNRVRQNTGIDLDLAQASGDRKLISLRAYAARYPGKSAELIQAADDAAQGQFETATNRVLDMIATSHPSEVAGSAGVNAATMVIAAARRNVSNSVRPLYEAAYKAVPVVDRSTKQGEQILDFLKLPYFQQAFAAGQKLRSLETGSAVKPGRRTTETLTRRTDEGIERAATTVESTSTGAKRVTSRLTSEDAPRKTPDGVLTRRDETVHRDITQPSLAELDYTKRALDEQIEAMQLAGQRQRARALKIKRDEFVAALDALPNQAWQAARAEYGELAKSIIDPLENGIVGVLAKVKSPKAATAAAKIFQDANVSPQQIAFARSQISKQEGGEEAWNGLVRQWMGQQFNKAMKETQTGDVVNAAGKFRQSVFGSPRDRAKAMAMMPQGAAKDFEELMFAAEKLASTPIAGSNTMRDLEIKEQLQGTGAVVFRWLTSPRQAVVDAAEQRALEQGTVAITEALLDPAKRSQLRRVVRMAPSTRQAILISSIIGGQATSKAAAGALSVDRMPPSQEQRPQQ